MEKETGGGQMDTFWESYAMIVVIPGHWAINLVCVQVTWLIPSRVNG
jgi:hypothetical protein